MTQRIGTSGQISNGMGAPGAKTSQRIGTSGSYMATAGFYDQEKDLLAIDEIGLLQRLGLLHRHVVRDFLVQFLCAILTIFGHMFMSVFNKQQQPEQHTDMLVKRRQAFLACCRRGKRSWRKHAQNKWHVRKAQRARWMLAIVLLGEFQLAKAMTSEQVAELLTRVGELAQRSTASASSSSGAGGPVRALETASKVLRNPDQFSGVDADFLNWRHTHSRTGFPSVISVSMRCSGQQKSRMGTCQWSP